MRSFSLIVIFSSDKQRVLMCKHRKAPYKNMLNFNGGHIEAGESYKDTAYRELDEECNIPRSAVDLIHILDFAFPLSNISVIEVWAGRLKHEINVSGDKNKPLWIPITEDFADITRFTGDGNIQYIMYYIELEHPQIFDEVPS